MSILRVVAVVFVIVASYQLQASAQEEPGRLRDAAMALLAPAIGDVSAVEVVFIGEPRGGWPVKPAAFRVDLFHRVPVPNSTETRREIAAELRLNVLTDGVLGSVSTRAMSIDGRMAAFTKVYNAHPSWTDAEAVRALRSAGARYLTDDAEALRRDVRFDALGPWIGTVAVGIPRFEIQSQADERAAAGSRERTLLGVWWRIPIQGKAPSGQEYRFEAVVEPFVGLIQDLVRVP